jgi:hypothetical protein
VLYTAIDRGSQTKATMYSSERVIVLFYVTGKWQHVKETTEINEGKLFSPGNLRATFDNPEYEKVI